MYLAITNGTTTIVLSGTAPVRGCTYYPQAAARDADGNYRNVTEDATVNLRDTQTAMRSSINWIETLLQQAEERRATGVGARIFALYKPVDGDSAAYRSEVYGGRVLLSNQPMLRRFGDTAPTIQIGIVWERAHWWEGDLTELQLSANGQAAATGGRTIYNNPANGNWVQIAANQTVGVLPSPLKLEVYNSAGASKNFRKLFVGVNSYSDAANFTHYLQAEARISGGTLAADATCSGSGNNRLDFTVTASPTVFTWSLPWQDLQRVKGRRVRLLARFADGVGDLYVTPAIRTGGGVTIWTGDELALGSLVQESWQDLGIVPLPPGGYAGNYDTHLLALSFRGSALVQLDVLQLTALDSYRYFELAGTGVAVTNGAAIVHDGTEGLTYIASSGWTALATSYGAPVLVRPGAVQRLYILWQINAAGTGGAGDAPIGNTASVRAYYRPRRLTV